MMQLSGKFSDFRKFPTAASKLRTINEHQSIEAGTYSEFASKIFDSLGEYKDSKELSKEAYYLAATYNYETYTNFSQKKLDHSWKYYLDRSCTQFTKAGDYKDASSLAEECVFTKMKEALADTRNVATLFQSIDNKLKEKFAELIYQRVAPRLAVDDWGMDEEIPDVFWPGPERRRAYFEDLSLLEIVKDYNSISELSVPLSTSPCRAICTVCGSSSRHKQFRNGINPYHRIFVKKCITPLYIEPVAKPFGKNK